MRLVTWRSLAPVSIVAIGVVAWALTRASVREALRPAAAAPGVVASAGVDDLGHGSAEAIGTAWHGVDPAETDWAAGEAAAAGTAPRPPAASSEPDPRRFGYATYEELTREVRRRLAIPERYPVEVRWKARGSRGALSVIVGPAAPAVAP
jgi:hypothetical protein